MKLRFDMAFDGSSWPGPLVGREAVFGEAWVGPMALLGLLETSLGLSAPHPTYPERLARLVPRLGALEGFWSRSFDADAFGTARRVLQERDTLWLCGWRGQGPSSRLAQLAEATREVATGVPDRLAAVATQARRRRSDIERIELLDPPDDLPHGWRHLFEALAEAGTEVVHGVLDPAAAVGDLVAARSKGFAPAADGSLQLVRPHGPLVAAEHIAGWLAAQAELHEVVVIGADATLDRALRRHGLPTSGATLDGDVLLQVLPLVVEMGWSPADPRLAHQLLVLPHGPVPGVVSRRLASTLQRRPAIDSDDWRAALQGTLDGIDDPVRQKRVRTQVQSIFDPVADRQHGYPVTALAERVALVRSWAERQVARGTPFESSFWRLVEKCRVFTLVVDVVGQGTMTVPELRRALELADEAVGTPALFQPQAGLAHIDGPDALCGAASRVIWWGFARRSAPTPVTPRLSAAESSALLAEGVTLPHPGKEAIRLARRWRRPLEQATEALLLVCPQRGVDGEALYPHPLWEEVEAQLDDTGSHALSKLVRRRPDLPEGVTQLQAAELELPSTRRRWQVPASTIGFRTESPSGMAALMGCPLNWTLNYVGKLRSGVAQPPPGVSGLSLGNLAHEMFHVLLSQQPLLDPEEATQQVEAFLAAEGARHVAPLFLPEREVELIDTRQRLTEAARTLFTHLHGVGATVQSTETAYEKKLGGVNFGGIPDVVLTDPAVVIDLKWGGRPRHTKALENGTAVQLAAYSALVGQAHSPVAYFILRTQELLVSEAGLFPDAVDVNGPAVNQTWDAAMATYRRCHRQLRRGVVLAAAVDDGAEPPGAGIVNKSVLGDGELALEAPCHFCSYGLICGLDLEVPV